MPAKKRLPIDCGAVARAMDEADRTREEYLLDTHTGAVVVLPRAALDMALLRGPVDSVAAEERAALPQAKAVVRAKPGHFVLIPHRPPPDQYDVMQRFVASVRGADLRRNLQRALGGQAPFRRFKEVLADDLIEEERWASYGDAVRQIEVREWLESLEIEVISSSSQS